MHNIVIIQPYFSRTHPHPHSLPLPLPPSRSNANILWCHVPITTPQNLGVIARSNERLRSHNLHHRCRHECASRLFGFPRAQVASSPTCLTPPFHAVGNIKKVFLDLIAHYKLKKYPKKKTKWVF
jgi:hypothetical protein